MVHREVFENLKILNNFIVNESITQSEIISIEQVYDEDNSSWEEDYLVLYYSKPSILGDTE